MIRRRSGQPRQLKQATLCWTRSVRKYHEPRRHCPLQRPWWPSWRPDERVLRGTATSGPSGVGSNSPRRADSRRSQPSRPNSSTSLPRGRKLTSAALRQRCASALSTRLSSWLGSPPSLRERHPRGVPARLPAGKACRPMFRGENSCEMPQESCPPPGARLSRQGLSPVESARALAAAGRLLMLLSDATARYDHINEGQLGEVLFEDKRTVVPSLGPNATAAEQASSPPGRRPPSLWSDCSPLRRCWRHSPVASPPLERIVIPPGQRPWRRGRPRFGLLPSPYRVGIPEHRLPIFGPWLFRDVTPSFHLACVLSTRAFLALAKRTIFTTGEDASNFGTHRVRRGAAAALFQASVPRPLVSQALRHASARSDESYILETAKLTAVAAAPCMPPRGRAAGDAAKPAGRFDELAAPPRGAAGGYSLRELLSMAAHWEPGWPAGWPRWAGFEQPADGSLRRL